MQATSVSIAAELFFIFALFRTILLDLERDPRVDTLVASTARFEYSWFYSIVDSRSYVAKTLWLKGRASRNAVNKYLGCG